jgi:acetylornithine deacetylase/succinyl-diaminopimelate desuccinylase-like protein
VQEETFTIPESEWKAVYDEALEYFRNLLRFDTTNPPGNEKEACEYLGTILAKENIGFEILESAPGRANLICRLQGDGSLPPLLLNAHLDVVPVERSYWTHDPFGGVLEEGFVWGRGALDMKHMAIMSLMTVILFHRHKARLKRDLVFAAVADEEAGGRYGSGWLVDLHPEKVKAEYALGEIGGFSRIVDGKHFYPVQIAEKGICWLRLKATGAPGHGSLPNWEGAVGKIGKAAHLLGSKRLPFHSTPQAAVFVETMAEHQPFPKGLVLRQALHPRWSRLVLDKVLPDEGLARMLYAILHNTANPTIIRGGEKVNVLPSEATLEVDGRVLPGQTKEDFLQEVAAVIGDDCEIEVLEFKPAVSVPPDDPILGSMNQVLRRHDPDAVVVPNMVPGFTDAKHYSRLGIRCFGFSPVRLPEDFNFVDLMHGHDERIPVEGFFFGVRVLCELAAHLCTHG